MPRYYIEMEQEGLGKHRVATGSDRAIVQLKARAQQAEWDRAWQARQRADWERAQKQ